MTTFDEGQHPRRDDGKFGPKAHQPVVADLEGSDAADHPPRLYPEGTKKFSGMAQGPSKEELLASYHQTQAEWASGDLTNEQARHRYSRSLHKLTSWGHYPRGQMEDDPTWEPSDWMRDRRAQVTCEQLVAEYDRWMVRRDTLSHAGDSEAITKLDEQMSYLVHRLAAQTETELEQNGPSS